MNQQCRSCGSEDVSTVQVDIQDYEYLTPGEWSYMACGECGIVFISPFPTMDLLKSSYPESYQAFANADSQSRLHNILRNQFQKGQLKLIRHKLKPNNSVLDVGCGAGELLSFIKSKYGIQDVTGIDFSPAAAEAVRGSGIECFEGLFIDYPTNKTYDLIIMNNYIEHTIYPKQEINKAFQLLNKGGVLFGTLPNYDSFDRMIFGKYWGGNHCPRHTFQFSPRVLREHFEQAGFTPVIVGNELHGGHISISISNFIMHFLDKGRTLPEVKREFRRVKFFPLLTLLVTPLSLSFALWQKNGAMHFLATKS